VTEIAGKRVTMRRLALWLLLCTLGLPTAAAAQHYAATPARCGFSFGLTAGVAVPTHPDNMEEFQVGGELDLEAKHYIWQPFAGVISVSGRYLTGDPERMEWHGKWIDLDESGQSFLRAAAAHGLLKVELGRPLRWDFNPYLGGGAGVLFNTLKREGTYEARKVSDYEQEFLPSYMALIGADYAFDLYVSLKFEVRWSSAPSNDTFVDKLDQGVWSGLIGIQIYL